MGEKREAENQELHLTHKGMERSIREKEQMHQRKILNSNDKKELEDDLLKDLRRKVHDQQAELGRWSEEQRQEDEVNMLRVMIEEHKEATRTRQAEQERRTQDVMKQLEKREEQLRHWKQRAKESQREMIQMRLTTEKTRSELKELTSKVEKETNNMMEEYEKEIERMRLIVREKDAALRRLEKESHQNVVRVTERVEREHKLKESKCLKQESRRCGQQQKKEEMLEIKERELARCLEAKQKQHVEREGKFKKVGHIQNRERRQLNLLCIEEVKQKEDHLKGLKGEVHQDLLQRTSQVEVQTEQVTCRMPQLDMTLLKEHRYAEQLRICQQSLEERQTKLTTAGSQSQEESIFMDQEGVGNRKMEADSGKFVSHLEAEEEGETERVEKEVWSPNLSPGRPSIGQPWSVLLLGENWSLRSPPGVTILGGDSPQVRKHLGFRSWKTQIAGRRLEVVEPIGLRWRDGPDQSGTDQRQNILSSASWCSPGPQVVLLLLPAYMACTREYRTAAKSHVNCLGKDAWLRTLLLVTWGETLGQSVEKNALKNTELAGLLQRCGGRFHVVTSRKNNSIIEGLMDKVENIVYGNL